MEHKIKVCVEVNASTPKVWQYYTEPQHIVHWNFASDDWHCPWAKNDLNVGGKYRSRMEAKDGSEGFDLEAVYEKIDHEAELVYKMADGRVAQVIFESIGFQHTRITILFDAETQNPPDLQKQGWQAILNHFKHYTEKSE